MPADIGPVEENLRASFRVLAAGRPLADVREVGGVTIASAGVAFQMFNAAFFSRPVGAAEGELDRRIATAAVHFRARALDWSFWACEDLIDNKIRRRAKSAFTRHGLRPVVDLPGMIAERLLPPRLPLPPVDIRRVDTEPERLAFCDIGSVCFNVPLPWFREIFLWEPIWRSSFSGYVGYVHGEPVASAATFIASGVIGVYNVATLPSHRHMGVGEAVMRRALAEARESSRCERSVLQSTEYGFGLYRRMGYKTATKVTVYASET